MRVLTSDAILDPTKVEAKVRRDVANRRLKHEKANGAAKLTDEQRREKKEKEKEKDEGRGLYSAVFKLVFFLVRSRGANVDGEGMNFDASRSSPSSS